MLYKKILPFLVVCTFVSAQDALEGQERLLNIAHNGNHGISSYNQQIKFVNQRNLLQDLNLLDVVNSFACQTKLGFSFLLDALKNPIHKNDTSGTIHRRKAILQSMYQNHDFKSDIQDLVRQAAAEEENVIYLLKNRKKYLDQLQAPEGMNQYIKPMSQYYRSFNKNSMVQTSLYALYLLMTSSSLLHGLYGISTTVKDFICPPDPQIEELADGSLKCITYKDVQAKNLSNLPFALISCIVSLNTCFSLYDTYAYVLDQRKLLHSLYKLVDIAEQIEEVCARYGIDQQFKMSDMCDEQGLHLIAGLQHSRYFHEDENLPILPSAVLVFLYEVYENDMCLAPVFASIAEMDAYNSLVNKMVSSRDSDRQICFVKFVEHDKPMVKAEGFWNLIVGDKAVVNSLHEDRNVILTGPNAGGKSTTIKAVLQNIVLGQTFGIAAAKEFIYTQFDIIHAFLYITDDIVNGLSRLQSEMKHAQEILQQIKALKHDEKYFFILDELFSGTGNEGGEICAYKYINNIACLPGVQFIYATHFDKLKELGNTHHMCTNYKINEAVKIDGKFVYPYTLSPGVNTSSIAIEMAQDAGLFD